MYNDHYLHLLEILFYIDIIINLNKTQLRFPLSVDFHQNSARKDV